MEIICRIVEQGTRHAPMHLMHTPAKLCKKNLEIFLPIRGMILTNGVRI